MASPDTPADHGNLSAGDSDTNQSPAMDLQSLNTTQVKQTINQQAIKESANQSIWKTLILALKITIKEKLRQVLQGLRRILRGSLMGVGNASDLVLFVLAFDSGQNDGVGDATHFALLSVGSQSNPLLYVILLLMLCS